MEIISDVRTWATRFILPLFFSNARVINKRDIGFVNAFLTDVNKPQLDNHLFIVYKSMPSIEAWEELNIMMRSSKYFYKFYTIKLENEFYNVYVFLLASNIKYYQDIKKMLENSYGEVDYQTKVKIISYWNFSIGTEEHEILFNEKKDIEFTLLDQQIPEEDSPNDFEYNIEVNSLEEDY